jgi:SSS family transporter
MISRLIVDHSASRQQRRRETVIGTIDLAVLAAYLAGVVALGVWIGRGQRSLDTFLLGDRNLPWWAILGSIVATETSTATFLSVPGLAFARDGGDLRFLQLSLGYIAGRAMIVVLLLPHFFRGELYSAYEVLAFRFGGAVKRTASLVFLVTRNLGDGLRLFLTAIVLVKWLGRPLPECVVVVGIVTIVYTTMGGMKSVVWNDCLQLAIYLVGGLFAGVVIVDRVGGWTSFSAFAAAEGKLRMFDFRFTASEPFTFWAGLVGGMFLTLGTHGTDQMMVQRLLCARSRRDASVALVASGFFVFAQFLLFLLLGVGLSCFYADVDPPRTFPSNDHVFATFIIEEMPRDVGAIGLMLAAILAAAMSTTASSLNSSAGAVVNDFLPRVSAEAPASGSDRSTNPHPRRSGAGSVVTTRVLTVAFGVVQIAIGIMAERLSKSVVDDALAIAGFSSGLLLGVFLLGVLTQRVDQRAALAGLVAGLAVLLVVKFVAPRYGLVVAWPWFAVIGSTVTYAAGLAASFRPGRASP